MLDECHKIRITMTKNCNLSCLYCTNHGYDFNHIDVEYAISTCKKLLNDIKNNNIEIEFFGGEPLLYDNDIIMIAQCIETYALKINKHISFSIMTNGTIINAKILNHFKKYHYNVKISCDGVKVANDKYRIGNNIGSVFNVIMKTIHQLLNNNIRTSIIMTIAKDCEQFMYDSVKLFKQLGINNIIIKKVIDNNDFIPNDSLYDKQSLLINNEFNINCNLHKQSKFIEIHYLNKILIYDNDTYVLNALEKMKHKGDI
jgi:uncharacterized protein